MPFLREINFKRRFIRSLPTDFTVEARWLDAIVSVSLYALDPVEIVLVGWLFLEQMEPMMLFGESGAFDDSVSRSAPSDRYFSIVDDRNAGCAFIVGSFG